MLQLTKNNSTLLIRV